MPLKFKQLKKEWDIEMTESWQIQIAKKQDDHKNIRQWSMIKI